MQTDPIGYSDGINWYAYVDSDPINRKDPTGLFEVACKDLPRSCSDNRSWTGFAAGKGKGDAPPKRGRNHEKVVDGLKVSRWAKIAAKVTGRALEKAVDEFDVEMGYSIFRHDTSLRHILETDVGYFDEKGRPVLDMTLDKKGYTLVLSGHLHNWPFDGASIFSGPTSNPGPSQDLDVPTRQKYPGVPFLLHQKNFAGAWETIEY